MRLYQTAPLYVHNLKKEKAERTRKNMSEMSIEDFIKKSSGRLTNILKNFGWTQDDLKKKDSNCEKSNPITKRKNDENNDEYPEAVEWKYSTRLDNSTISAITLKKNAEIPKSLEDSHVFFNREERLKIYEHVIQQTGHFSEPEISILVEQESGGSGSLTTKPMTLAEYVAKERNLKRRRLRHRTTKEPPHSRTEELRQLIEMQMEALKRLINESRNDAKDKRTETPEKRRRDSCRNDQPSTSASDGKNVNVSSRKRYRSRSRSRNRKKDDRRHKSSHKQKKYRKSSKDSKR